MIKEYSEYMASVENLFNDIFNKTADIITCNSYYTDKEIHDIELYILNNLFHQDKSTLCILINKCINSMKK